MSYVPHEPATPTEEAFATLSPAAVPAAPARPVPAPHVDPRADATVDPAMIRLGRDAAVKQNTFPSRPGDPSGMAHWQTHLHLEVWVENTTYAKSVWVDVHLFGHDGALVASETFPFAYVRPAGDGGDVFQLDRVVYEGATSTPGSATPRPDVRLVEYRLYCELDGRVVTDGELHHCVLATDALSG